MGRVQGKVAFVTGAARGQGRSHAVRLAEEGADIIAVDRCEDFATVGYPMATPEDLEETAHFVEKTGQRVVTAKVDVADGGQLKSALDDGIAELGKLDIVVTAAGIAGMKGSADLAAWIDVMNTNLIGTINAIHVALPHLGEGASIVATGSTAALMDVGKNDNPGADPGGAAYLHSKRLLSQYVHNLAAELAPRGIRANVVHPTNTNTPDAAERTDVQVLPSGPGGSDPGRRRTGVLRAAGDEGSVGRARGHQQHGAVPGIG